jgi:hypothetical protein
VFLELDDKGDDREKEADRFASDHLIPAAPYRSFVEGGDFDAECVSAFAASLGIGPGIVVGRLQRDGHLPAGTRLNKLKRRYRFADELAEKVA